MVPGLNRNRAPDCQLKAVDFLCLRGGGSFNARIMDAAMVTIFSLSHNRIACPTLSGDDTQDLQVARLNTDKIILAFNYRDHWAGLFINCISSNATEVKIYNSMGQSHANSTCACATVSEALSSLSPKRKIQIFELDKIEQRKPHDTNNGMFVILATERRPADAAAGLETKLQHGADILTTHIEWIYRSAENTRIRETTLSLAIYALGFVADDLKALVGRTSQQTRSRIKLNLGKRIRSACGKVSSRRMGDLC
jgi:hypothetical protein